MTYQAGQRVELVHTSDPYTRLRPGARGTVTHHIPDLHTVHIAWDDGSTLAMLLDAGDRIRVINDQPSPGNQPDAPDAGGEQLLDRAPTIPCALADGAVGPVGVLFAPLHKTRLHFAPAGAGMHTT